MLNFFRENETVYMVMNYLQGDTLQDFIVTARDLKRDKVFRESTIRSLFDEILRGLRIVHQHKMLHLDIKPANIFITNENKAVLLDFGAAREVLSKEGNFIRPMYTPGFAAPEMYRRDGTLGPWTDIYAIGACIYACMQGYPPNDAPQRIEKDRLALSLSRLRNVYSDNLIEVTEWCMSLDPLSRPQSVFALQKELSRETERQYTKLSFSERLKLQLENLTDRARRPDASPCASPSTRSAARAAARRTKTAWAIATRATRACSRSPTAWAAIPKARSPRSSRCRRSPRCSSATASRRWPTRCASCTRRSSPATTSCCATRRRRR